MTAATGVGVGFSSGLMLTVIFSVDFFLSVDDFFRSSFDVVFCFEGASSGIVVNLSDGVKIGFFSEVNLSLEVLWTLGLLLSGEPDGSSDLSDLSNLSDLSDLSDLSESFGLLTLVLELIFLLPGGLEGSELPNAPALRRSLLLAGLWRGDDGAEERGDTDLR